MFSSLSVNPRSRAKGTISAHGDAGFTLLEMLVVLGIIALLATIATPQVLKYLGRARTEAAKAQISAISTSLELYALDNGAYPTSEIGLSGLVQQPPNLATWRGPYLKKTAALIDPWGRGYHYTADEKDGSPKVFSLGRDNATGGDGEDQDISN